MLRQILLRLMILLQEAAEEVQEEEVVPPPPMEDVRSVASPAAVFGINFRTSNIQKFSNSTIAAGGRFGFVYKYWLRC